MALRRRRSGRSKSTYRSLGITSLPGARHRSGAPRAKMLESASANSIDQADTPTLKLLDVPQLKRMTTLRRRKQRLPVTSNQRMRNKPEFIDQPGIDQARRGASAADEIDVLAGLLLEGSDFIESPDETRRRPACRRERARQHIMRGLRHEAGPVEFRR